MAFLEWHEGLSVGDDMLDKEHQQIMSYINDLHNAIEQGLNTEILGTTLDNVLAYSNYHFRHEESLFSATDYPDAKHHIHEHDSFTKKILNIHSQFRFGNPSQLSIDLLIFLKEWLMNHIQGTDKGYVLYLKKAADEKNKKTAS